MMSKRYGIVFRISLLFIALSLLATHQNQAWAGRRIKSAPVITAISASGTIVKLVGSSVSFSVTASGSPSPTYQWLKNGIAIVGATSSGYSIASLTTSDAGNYSVRASNNYGSVLSSPITLNVSTPTTVTSTTTTISSPPPVTSSSSIEFTQSASVAKYNTTTASVDVSRINASRTLFSGDSVVQDGLQIYVSASAGSDTTGNGLLETPYKTISKAIKSLTPTSLGSASKFNVIVRGGTYRETLDLGTSLLAGTTIPVVIQSAPNEVVLIKGSDVMTGWQSHGNGLFSLDYCVVNTAAWKTYSPCVPLEQVVYDRQMLQQVAGTVFDGFPLNTASNYRSGVLGLNIWRAHLAGNQSTMPDSSFYYATSLDALGKPIGKLYIKLPSSVTDISSRVVEVATRPYVFKSSGISNVSIRNLNFEHSNTTANLSHATGAINLINSNYVTIDRVSVAFMDGTCVSTSGWNSALNAPYDTTNVTIKNSHISYCGQIGLGGWGSNATIQSNTFSFNNLRGFNNNWATGGMKFVGAGGIKNSNISDNDIFRNFSSGFWCDYCKVGGNTFNQNRIYYNDEHGIHFEVSTGTHFSANYIYGNGAHGIYHRESTKSTFDGNYILWHQGYGFSLWDNFSAASRAMAVFGTPAIGSSFINNKIAFGNMSGANATSLMQFDWWGQNSSNNNIFINKLYGTTLAPFPWQLYGRNGSAPTTYTGFTTLQNTVAQWKTATGNDATSLKFDKDPMNVTLPGETRTLQNKILSKEPIPTTVIQSYFNLLAQ